MSLLERIAKGDATAVKACVDRYGALVMSLAVRFSESRADAEDAVQEVFVDLWKNAARYDASRASEVTFVAMLARRRLIDRRRARARRPGGVDLDEVDRALSVAPAGEASAEVSMCRAALEGLRPEQKRVLFLSACEGYTHEEIAAELSMPLGTVKAHARRALLRVRDTLFGSLEPAR